MPRPAPAPAAPSVVHVRVDTVVLAGVPRGREAVAVRALRRRLDELAHTRAADARWADADLASATARPRDPRAPAALGAGAADAIWAAATAAAPATQQLLTGADRW